jgi:predicted LPLAT superfamily acyltransferase
MRMSAMPPRNPGPSWGFRFLLEADRLTPRWILAPLLMAGTWIAVVCLPVQRRHSRAFLVIVLRRRVGLLDVWRHFYAFLQFLLLRFRAGRGVPMECVLNRTDAAAAQSFETLLASGETALFGTFHFGYSDLLGFLLGRDGRRVAIVRQRVGNSDDTRWLEQQYQGVSFIWSNDPADLPFKLKEAIEGGESLALQCDRVERSSRTEVFEFLERQRVFPFTIYHLALLFAKPVAFCLAVPGTRGELQVTACPIFRADPTLSREANLVRARDHFQAVLVRVETLVRHHPYLWFNFLPLNPEVGAARAN